MLRDASSQHALLLEKQEHEATRADLQDRLREVDDLRQQVVQIGGGARVVEEEELADIQLTAAELALGVAYCCAWPRACVFYDDANAQVLGAGCPSAGREVER